MNTEEIRFYKYWEKRGVYVGPTAFKDGRAKASRDTFFRIAALVVLSELMWVGTVALACLWFPRGGWVQTLLTCGVLATVLVLALVRTVLLARASLNTKPWTIMTARTLIRWRGGETPRITRMFCFPPPVHTRETLYFCVACYGTTALAIGLTVAVIPLAILHIVSLGIALFGLTYAASGWVAWWAWTYAGIVLPRDRITLEDRA